MSGDTFLFRQTGSSPSSHKPTPQKRSIRRRSPRLARQSSCRRRRSRRSMDFFFFFFFFFIVSERSRVTLALQTPISAEEVRQRQPLGLALSPFLVPAALAAASSITHYRNANGRYKRGPALILEANRERIPWNRLWRVAFTELRNCARSPAGAAPPQINRPIGHRLFCKSRRRGRLALSTCLRQSSGP